MSGGGGGPSQTTNTTQQSQTQPWAPAVPELQTLLSSIAGVSPTPTSAQTSAGNALVTAAGGVPNFGQQGIGAVNQLFGSTTTPQQGLLSDAYNQLQKTLGPYSDPNYTNPYTNPALSSAMGTLGRDITNQISSTWNAAGRGGSPGFQQNVARGLEQGLAPVLAGQYNTNVGQQQAAAGQLFGGGTQAATTGAALGQIPLQNQIAALGAAGQIPGLLTQPATTQLGAANTQYGIPLSNIGQLEGLTTPIAGLGQSSTGSGTSTTQQSNPLFNQILGGALGGAGILGSLGGSGGLPALMMMSDERVKENIRPVGILFDKKLPVYAYNFKFDPFKRQQIGLLAQEVEHEIPEAVAEIGGLKMVDYGLATARAANTLPA